MNLHKNQFEEKLDNTSAAQEDILKNFQVDICRQLNDIHTHKFTETLNNLEFNELENQLQSTLEMLGDEHSRLLKTQQSYERDLDHLKKVLVEETKKQRIYHVQILASNSNQENILNDVPKTTVGEAHEDIELKMKLLKLTERKSSLQQSLGYVYGHIPDNLDAANAKAIELEQKFVLIDEQIASTVQDISLNDSNDD